jgi:hypothetical protein
MRLLQAVAARKSDLLMLMGFAVLASSVLMRP